MSKDGGKGNEFFFVCEPFARKSQRFVSAAAELLSFTGGTCSNAYYRADTDIALLSVEFHTAPTEKNLISVLKLAQDSNIPVLERNRLNKSNLSAFEKYLRKYTVQVEQCDTPQTALLRLCVELSIDVQAKGAKGKTALSRVKIKKSAGSYSKQVKTSKPQTPSSRKTPRPISNSNNVTVRFRRGDLWSAARIRTLAARTAHIATPCPPRKNDKVLLEVSLGDLVVSLSAQVTSIERSDGNPTGCWVRFSKEGVPASPKLVALLSKAQSLNVRLEAPPNRIEARHQVEWPVRIYGSAFDFTARARDISRNGLFIATNERLPAGPLTFQLPTDVDGQLVIGEARVARVLDKKDALDRSIEPGYGLQITSLPEEHRAWFSAFIDRIGQRSNRQIIVGASSEFVGAIAASLRGAGYTVSARTEQRQLLTLAASFAVPPDAAFLDSSLGKGGDLSKLQSAVESRDVRCITGQAQYQDTARLALDKLLSL